MAQQEIQQKAAQMLAVLEHRVQRARGFPIDFVNFCLKEETTKRPIRCAPHQRVLLKFVQDHAKSVILLPVAHSKTFSMGALCLFYLGQDPTARGAILSATQAQGAKVLGMVRDYIESSNELRVVFPELKPSSRRSDPWTTTSITVNRPPGIRDPSLQAVGLEGAINGSRLRFIVIDDILTHENTLTREARNKTFDFLDSTVQSRLDVNDSKIVVTNTAWHDDDVAHRFMKQGWPTLRMEITGDIEILNDDDWDCAEIRPASLGSHLCRLASHEDGTPLWPEKFTQSKIESLRTTHLPQRFNQLYCNKCYDESTAHCKGEWIELCKRKARERGIHSMVSSYRGPNLTCTGVDLAVQQGEQNDDTAFFTFEALPDGHRVILDVEVGKFDGPTIVKKLIAKHQAYNSIIRLESNSAQDFVRQFALDSDVSLPIKAHVTGRMKVHPEHGIEGIFVEMSNGAWLIPNDPLGNVHPHIAKFISACLSYSPTRHTDDVLIGAYLAREQAKAFGAGGRVTTQSNRNIAASIMSR